MSSRHSWTSGVRCRYIGDVEKIADEGRDIWREIDTWPISYKNSENLLQNIVRDLLYFIEGQVKPGDVLGTLHEVQGQLVQAVGVDQVVVGESDDVTVVPAHPILMSGSESDNPTCRTETSAASGDFVWDTWWGERRGWRCSWRSSREEGRTPPAVWSPYCQWSLCSSDWWPPGQTSHHLSVPALSHWWHTSLLTLARWLSSRSRLCCWTGEVMFLVRTLVHSMATSCFISLFLSSLYLALHCVRLRPEAAAHRTSGSRESCRATSLLLLRETDYSRIMQVYPSLLRFVFSILSDNTII